VWFRRFRVVERGTKDGYNTAVVEFLSDQIPEGTQLDGTYIDPDLIGNFFLLPIYIQIRNGLASQGLICTVLIIITDPES